MPVIISVIALVFIVAAVMPIEADGRAQGTVEKRGMLPRASRGGPCGS